MEHTFFFDGNQKKIAWAIKTLNDVKKQSREHAEIYLDKVSAEQSKYIALHVGIFWCIGVFIIKNEDTVNIMTDTNSIYEHLNNHKQQTDSFIIKRTGFIEQLIEQRKLQVKFHIIKKEENLASKLLE